jgi:S-adenosylmethionine decarboxylase
MLYKVFTEGFAAIGEKYC